MEFISATVVALILVFLLIRDPVNEGLHVSYLWILFGALICLSVLLFNQKGYYNIARWIISWCIPLIIFSLSLYEKSFRAEHIGIQDFYLFRFLLLVSSIIPLLVFSTRDIKYLMMNLAPTFIGCVFFNPIHNAFGVGISDFGFDDSKILLFDYIVGLSYMAMVGFLINQRIVFDKIESRLYINKRNLEEINQELLHKNSFINEQNHEMNAQSDKLKESHDALIVASRTIERQKLLLEKQNKTLEIQVLAKTKELSRINEELIINNNEMRQFSHTLSHNLKSPVATFQGLLNLVGENELGKENKLLFGYLNESVQKMQDVFSDMHEMLELRNNLYNSIEEVDLQKQIDALHSYFYPELNANNIQFTYDISGTRIIRTNEKRLQSILYHLISNSIKFKSRVKRPEIHITLHQNGKYQVLSIKDNGIGLDLKKYSHKVFYPYQRFHNPSSGKGLGLYLVKVQAESLGGKVTLDSRVNEYTLVEVHLQK
ncbi:MAG: HAMP domain-containing sensor histidine kinase [Cyclobacteriaceae bacterium]|nr:HAMP domain-containing sensor histidine kinase [Cyclobacteriaceae bacterium]